MGFVSYSKPVTVKKPCLTAEEKTQLLLDRPLCPTCQVEGVFMKGVKTNGTYNVQYRCEQCRYNIGLMLYNHCYLPNSLFDLQCLPEYQREDREVNVCCYNGCDRTDTEMHHFAPYHLFPDADKWPVMPLCREHHALWHKITGTGSYKRR